MPGLVEVVRVISNNVIEALAAAGYPPLCPLPDGTAGKILMGRQRQFEQHAPPRIILTPTASVFSGVDVYSNQPTPAGVENRLQHQYGALGTEFVRFECRCWGASANADPKVVRDDDYDRTQVLYQTLIRAIRDACGPFTKGGVELENGGWTDATFQAPQEMVYGREFVFGVKIPTPLLDKLYPYAPSDVAADPRSTLTTPSGGSGQGCGTGA